MYPTLVADLDALPTLLERTRAAAVDYLAQLNTRPASMHYTPSAAPSLPIDGIGGAAALDHLLAQYGAGMTANAGPRYWGFVTGGTTPAALMGDWLTSAFDINAIDRTLSAAPTLEAHTIALLRQLFGLPAAFEGAFVSGASSSNAVGLATGREWVTRQRGRSAALHGLYGHAPIPVLAAAAHSSAIKALSAVGMGRDSLHAIAKQPDREAIDLGALEAALQALDGQPCIVVASAGTVNTVDFDDLVAIAALKERFPFWLHVDAAFGGFAACTPRFRHLMAGVEAADSLTIDAHKWLNVPYDSAMIFTRHLGLQTAVYQSNAAYLGDIGDSPDFFHLTPETSRRLRALPAWMTLMAYGSAGCAEIVERTCALAAMLGDRIAASSHFRLLAPVRMNVVCFTLAADADGNPTSQATVTNFLDRLRADGRVFLTPTVYAGAPAMRAAFSNWRTLPADLDIAWAAMTELVAG